MAKLCVRGDDVVVVVVRTHRHLTEGGEGGMSLSSKTYPIRSEILHRAGELHVTPGRHGYVVNAVGELRILRNGCRNKRKETHTHTQISTMSYLNM